jgi:hypothetical protein
MINLLVNLFWGGGKRRGLGSSSLVVRPVPFLAFLAFPGRPGVALVIGPVDELHVLVRTAELANWDFASLLGLGTLGEVGFGLGSSGKGEFCDDDADIFEDFVEIVGKDIDSDLSALKGTFDLGVVARAGRLGH